MRSTLIRYDSREFYRFMYEDVYTQTRRENLKVLFYHTLFDPGTVAGL